MVLNKVSIALEEILDFSDFTLACCAVTKRFLSEISYKLHYIFSLNSK